MNKNLKLFCKGVKTFLVRKVPAQFAHYLHGVRTCDFDMFMVTHVLFLGLIFGFYVSLIVGMAGSLVKHIFNGAEGKIDANGIFFMFTYYFPLIALWVIWAFGYRLYHTFVKMGKE